MATEYKLSYTATQIDEKLGKIDSLVATVNGIAPDENGNVQIPVSGGNVDQEQITIAINTALAQAKASGEFDGQPGQPGKDGVDGKDGYTPVKGVDYFDGNPGKDGADGAPGEKGDKGDKGEPGKDGANGKDGTSVTHSWNGTTLTVTSASGTSSADLKGAKGDKGDTGATGPAYALTAADKTAIVNAVIAALPVYDGEVV